MANDPAFLFYPGDYLRDTQCLSEQSQVAYDRIMCEHMRNICISQPLLNFFTKRLTPDQKSELETILTKVPGGYQIAWVAESIEKRKEYSESRRKNRTSSKNISSSYDRHMENENENVIEVDNEVEIWPTFENFWDKYSKKVDRPKCEAKWKKISQGAREKIMNHLDVYIPSTPDVKYRRNPSTYLNNESWNNEIVKNGITTKITREQRDQFIDAKYGTS